MEPLTLLIYQGKDTKGHIDKDLWRKFYSALASAICDKESQLIEEWENAPESGKPDAPQTVNIQSSKHSSNHGVIVPEDVESQQFVKEFVEEINLSGKTFKAWPVPDKTAKLWFNVPTILVECIEPSKLFKTLPYRNGWPHGQCEYRGCENDPNSPDMKIVTFLAKESLVNHIRQNPLMKINLASSYIYHQMAKVSPDAKIEYKYHL